MRRYRALLPAGAVPVAAAAMRGWLAAGHEIVGIDRDIGPPTCAPPRPFPLAVEMDLADRHFRVRRKRPWTILVRKLRKLAIQLSERDSD